VSSGRALAVSEVHTPLRDGQPWLAVLTCVDDGRHVVGLGRAPLTTGDDVVAVGEEAGVPVFGRRETAR